MGVSAVTDSKTANGIFAIQETTAPTKFEDPTTATTRSTTEETRPKSPDSKENIYKDFSYSVKGKAVTITKYNGNAKSVTIPSEIDGKKVRVIGKSAFRSDEINSLGLSKKNKTLEKITIPDSVYEIESYAFYKCVNLSKITIGKNIKKLGSYAFFGCKSLKEFKIPSKVTKFTSGVLGRTGITTLHFGKNIKKITYYDLFYRELEKITVAKGNKKYSSKDGVLYNKKQTKLIFCPRALNKTTITLPNTVKEIEDFAFVNNKKLRTVNLSNVENIGMMAFDRCKNLREITIPESTKLIQEFAFSSCAKLEKITFLNKNVELYDCAFSSCGVKEVEVPYQSEDAFRSCPNLKKITIPPDMEILGSKEFFNCPKLKSVTVPKTVKHIFKKALGFRYKTVDGNLKIVKVKGFTIKGVKNSAAHKYAKKNGFKFVEIN